MWKLLSCVVLSCISLLSRVDYDKCYCTGGGYNFWVCRCNLGLPCRLSAVPWTPMFTFDLLNNINSVFIRLCYLTYFSYTSVRHWRNIPQIACKIQGAKFARMEFPNPFMFIHWEEGNYRATHNHAWHSDFKSNNCVQCYSRSIHKLYRSSGLINSYILLM